MTDFEEWLDEYVDPDDYEEVSSLYFAVRTGEPINDAPWEITLKGGKMFVRREDGEWLVLVHDRAIFVFLEMMDKKFGHGMDVESWADCERTIASDKS